MKIRTNRFVKADVRLIKKCYSIDQMYKDNMYNIYKCEIYVIYEIELDMAF